MITLAAFVLSGLNSHGASQWEFDGNIVVPGPNTLFLAIDSRGNLYATTFNTASMPAEVFAFRITNPNAKQPRVTIFDRFEAPPQRGYAGITCDSSDNIYLSVDLGDQQPSFIRKYLPNLKADRTFGNEGVLASKEVRVLGLTSHKERILAAVSWGRFLVIDSTGKFLGITPKVAVPPYIRDIAYVPTTKRVYGVDRDGLFAFIGGTLDRPDQYQLIEVVEPHFILKSGIAIYYNKMTNELFYTDRSAGGLAIYPLDGSPRSLIPMAPDARGALEPADAVASADGRFLYVSDLRARQIARYRYIGPKVVRELSTLTPSQHADKPSAAGGLTDFDQALQVAKSDNKHILAFFHSPFAPRSVEVASNVFTPEFVVRFSEVVWVTIDVAQSPQSVSRFGIFKVPAVVLFDNNGQEVDRIIGEITQEQVKALIQKSLH